MAAQSQEARPMALYPLKFKPRYLEKIWGGRKIQTILGKQLPPGKSIGESWEIYDFPPGIVDSSGKWASSEIANGPQAGRTLHDLVNKFGKDLYGDVALVGPQGQFPILIKFLDAREDLSVQVHPDEQYARQNPGAHLKSEAWYIVQADDGARLLKGLKPGTTREAFAGSIANGTVESLINAVPVSAGHCHYLPSGTIHALGAGILAAEVQTPSDTTFRVFDFNRIETATGKTRALHVEQAMNCIDFSDASALPQPRSHVASHLTTVSRLVTCEFFKLEKVRLSDGVVQPVAHTQPVVWIMLEGRAQIKVDGIADPTEFSAGDTLLLPARMNNPILKTMSDCVWLEVTFPTPSLQTSPAIR
jgi:mannose-6-phosphate isomerase